MSALDRHATSPLVVRFVCKAAGVLYEDSTIQIGYKVESKTHLARLVLFYGNKTQAAFSDLQILVSCPGDLATKLLTQVKPTEPTVAASAQVQQVVHFICVQDFYTLPVAKVSFSFT